MGTTKKLPIKKTNSKVKPKPKPKRQKRTRPKTYPREKSLLQKIIDCKDLQNYHFVRTLKPKSISLSENRLNEKLIQEICGYVSYGCSLETAAALAAISQSTFYKWIRIGNPDKFRTSREEILNDPVYKLCVNLRQGVLKAMHSVELKDLQCIDAATQGFDAKYTTDDNDRLLLLRPGAPPNWKAAMARLAKRHKLMYGDDKSVQINNSNTNIQGTMGYSGNGIKDVNEPTGNMVQDELNKADNYIDVGPSNTSNNQSDTNNPKKRNDMPVIQLEFVNPPKDPYDKDLPMEQRLKLEHPEEFEEVTKDE